MLAVVRAHQLSPDAYSKTNIRSLALQAVRDKRAAMEAMIEAGSEPLIPGLSCAVVVTCYDCGFGHRLCRLIMYVSVALVSHVLCCV